MSDIDPIFTVEEANLDAVKKRGPNAWVILGGILVVFAIVLGWRRAAAKQKRSRPAVPTAELPA